MIESTLTFSSNLHKNKKNWHYI